MNSRWLVIKHWFKLITNIIVDDVYIHHDSVSIDMSIYLQIWAPSCKQGQLWIHIWQVWWMIPAPRDRCLLARRPLGTPQTPKRVVSYYIDGDNRFGYIKSIEILKIIASSHLLILFKIFRCGIVRVQQVRDTIKCYSMTKVKPLFIHDSFGV